MAHKISNLCIFETNVARLSLKRILSSETDSIKLTKEKIDKGRRESASKKSDLKSLKRDLDASNKRKSEAKAELKEEKPSKKQ
jgi:hypothetical protein